MGSNGIAGYESGYGAEKGIRNTEAVRKRDKNGND